MDVNPLILSLDARDPGGDALGRRWLAPIRASWRLLEAGVADAGSRFRDPEPGVRRVGPAGLTSLLALIAGGLGAWGAFPGSWGLALGTLILAPALLLIGILTIFVEGMIGRNQGPDVVIPRPENWPLIGVVFAAERALRVSASLVSDLEDEEPADLVLARAWHVLPAACLLSERWRSALVYAPRPGSRPGFLPTLFERLAAPGIDQEISPGEVPGGLQDFLEGALQDGLIRHGARS